ncbi:MAG: S24 family peptidase [Bradyrhizobium sp.]
MAEAIGVQPSYITRILNVEATGAKNIGDDLARRIEEVARKTENWLDHQHRSGAQEGRKPHAELGELEVDNARVARPMRGLVPIISWVNAGPFAEIEDAFLPPEEYEWVETTELLSEKEAIVLEVPNESMWDKDDPKSFPPGCLIVVKRADLRPPVNGDNVVVRLENEKKATFKRLEIDGDRVYLRALNSRYPIIEVKTHATFVGVVVEKIIRTRY